MAAEWTLTDAWVFACLGDSGPGHAYSLRQVLHHAELINHGCFAEVQFTRSVPRLITAGLVGVNAEADQFWHTKAGRALYRKRLKRHGPFDWMDEIPPALQRFGEPQDFEWSLPAGAFERAKPRR